MSKIGRKPITIPAGVEVKISGQQVCIKGPKGELKRAIHQGVMANAEAGRLTLEVSKVKEGASRLWGLERALLANMILGVSQGFEKRLELVGVGFRATVQGKKIILSLGFSHPVEIVIPVGIEAKMEKNVLVLRSINKELLGRFASEVHQLKPPEPYKGKGIKYVGEHIRRKEGKKAAATEGAAKA